MSCPINRIEPFRAEMIPEMALTVVVFPAPLLPRRDTIFFSSILKVTALKTWTCP
jgi:hypothetical protein